MMKRIVLSILIIVIAVTVFVLIETKLGIKTDLYSHFKGFFITELGTILGFWIARKL